LGNLREGQNLVLPVPALVPIGIETELERALVHEGWAVSGFMSEDAFPPLDQLFEVLHLEETSGTPRSVARLRQRLSPGQIVLVHGIGIDSWPSWGALLIEYEVASRDVSVFDRPLIIVVVSGVPLDQMPDQAAALRVLPWWGVIGEFDTVLYAYEALRGRGPPNPRLRLVARIIARLALWDFDLVDYLLDVETRQLFDPALVLGQAARSLEYSVALDARWEAGGLQSIDGVEMKHPFLLLAGADGCSELVMRLWAAHAAEILPILELHRRALAQRMLPLLRKPIFLNEEEVQDINDVEIGALAYLARRQKLNASILHDAEKLRRLRNKLAHLVPLDAEEALDRNLFPIAG